MPSLPPLLSSPADSHQALVPPTLLKWPWSLSSVIFMLLSLVDNSFPVSLGLLGEADTVDASIFLEILLSSWLLHSHSPDFPPQSSPLLSLRLCLGKWLWASFCVFAVPLGDLGHSQIFKNQLCGVLTAPTVSSLATLSPLRSWCMSAVASPFPPEDFVAIFMATVSSFLPVLLPALLYPSPSYLERNSELVLAWWSSG